MSSEGFPPPPPNLTPPHNLAPPPGAVGYEGRPWGAVRLQRVGGLAKALTILLAIAAAGQVLTAVFIPSQIDNARDLLAGRIDDDQFTERQVGYVGVSFLTGAATIAIMVLTMIWLHRIASNHRALNRAATWGPGWAIGGWFLPPLLYVIPTLMVREHWKAAEPTSPPGDDSWRRSPEPWLVWLWFVVYSLAPIVILSMGDARLFGAGFSNDVEDIAEGMVDTETGLWLSAAAGIGAALLWALVVRGLTARHRQLTGEVQGR